MEAVLSRLQTLTPDELREEIIRAGLKCGPITATTRSIFEKKLARTLVESQGVGGQSEVDGGSSQRSPTADPEATRLEDRDLSTSPQTLEGASQQAAPESPSLFYGVLPPSDDPLLNDGSLHVYGDKQKALRAVLKMKGARFKAFSSREDAENFAKGVCDGGLSPSKPLAETSPAAEKSIHLEMVNMEKPNEFKSPRIQDLTAKLRNAVETGDEEAFKGLVWENPRYLIGSGDNPTIVQEGCRYNVLHVAAKENRPGMARLILETLENPKFMRLMYRDDREDMLWQRIDYIVDLYLNTPDKGSNETPLHFACKFGCSEVVDVLCSHPAIDKNCRNKYGQKPSSVICERKNKSKEIKEKIKEYLEGAADGVSQISAKAGGTEEKSGTESVFFEPAHKTSNRFFVPLLRATDNTLNPVIGVPWAPGSSESGGLALHPGLADDPKNPVMTIIAFAGPLNPLKAEEFHKLWKTPPRGRARYFHDILKSDPNRGAERVGRELAHEMGYPWAEYWDFLNCFTDLSAEEGLNMLEEYLNRISQEKNATEKIQTHINSPSFSGPTSISGSLLSNHLHSPSGSSGSWTDKSSPRSFHEKYPVCDLLQDFERVSLDQASEEAENTGDSGLGGLAGSREGDGPDLDSLRGLKWVEDSDSSSEEYYTADEGTDALCQEDGGGRQFGILARNGPWSRGERDLSSSGSSSSSYKSTHSTPEDTETTELLGQNLFLAGESPSRLDSEVLLAVTGADVDQQVYPFVSKWKEAVSSHPESERRRWPSVTVTHRHREMQTSTPHRLTQSWLRGSPSFLTMKRSIPRVHSSTPCRPHTSS